MTASRLRSLLLSLLVIISLLLSFSIWHGDWLNRSEAGLSGITTTPAVPMASLPMMSSTEVPYQMVLKTGKQPVYSVELPGSSAYNDWLQRLAALSISGLKPTPQSTADAAVSTVQIQFGNTLDRSAIVQLLPALRNDAFAEQMETATLFQTTPAQPVMLELSSPNEPDYYVGRTDMPPQEFQSLLDAAAASSPWVALTTNQVTGYLPAKQLHMQRYVWKDSQPATIPLVHSFFTQPNALTRIQEGNDVLWTDGSRAVQWSPLTGTMTFNDPNAATTGSNNANDLEAAVTFIQNHGGSKTGLVPFGPYAEQQAAHAITYVLRPEVGGLPVLAEENTYQVSLTNGHVTKYVRPTIDESAVKSTMTLTLSGGTLASIVSQELKSAHENHLELVLGYAVITDANDKSHLEPAVAVMNGTNIELEVDAVTGQILQGGGVA